MRAVEQQRGNRFCLGDQTVMRGHGAFWHVRLAYCVQASGLRLKYMGIVQQSVGMLRTMPLARPP